MQVHQFHAATAHLTDTNRPIRLRLWTERGRVNDRLLVKHVSGAESLCGGIEYRVLCIADTVGIPLKQFTAAAAELQFVTDRGALHIISGIVAEVAEGESDGGLATYQLVVRDALALMEKRVNTRVFRNASEVEITNTLLKEWITNNSVLAASFDFALHTASYPAREFTMQYNESDAAFLRRLWKRRGLAWFFGLSSTGEKHTDAFPRHRLVIFDDAWALAGNAAGIVRYHRDGATETRDSITTWHAMRSLSVGRVTRHSWDGMQSSPQMAEEISANRQGTLGDRFGASLDEYIVDTPHAGDDTRDYKSLARLRIQQHE